jgi:hypothetical protein
MLFFPLWPNLRLPSGADGGMQNSAGIFPLLLSLGQMLIRLLILNSWPVDFFILDFPLQLAWLSPLLFHPVQRTSPW